MKVAVPVDEKSMQTGVCPSFGRAPYFWMFDMETQESIFLDNSAASSQGGAGIKAAQALLDQGIKAVLTPRCGENAAEVLKAADIALYKTIQGSARENVEAFADGKLALLQDIHPGFHGHGGQ